MEGKGCSPRQCPPRKANCVDATVCRACASVHTCGAEPNVRDSEGRCPPASPPGVLPLHEWQCPLMDLGMGEGGWGHSGAGPLEDPSAGKPLGPGPTCGGNGAVLLSSRPGPSACELSIGSCLFPPGEGRGHGRDSKMGFPRSQEALVPAAQGPPTLLSPAGGGHAWALRGPASLGDSASVHPRHVLGSPGTFCSPARRAGGEPGSGPQGPAYRCSGDPSHHLHASEPPLRGRGWRSLLRPTPSAWQTG